MTTTHVAAMILGVKQDGSGPDRSFRMSGKKSYEPKYTPPRSMTEGERVYYDKHKNLAGYKK